MVRPIRATQSVGPLSAHAQSDVPRLAQPSCRSRVGYPNGARTRPRALPRARHRRLALLPNQGRRQSLALPGRLTRPKLGEQSHRRSIFEFARPEAMRSSLASHDPKGRNPIDQFSFREAVAALNIFPTLREAGPTAWNWLPKDIDRARAEMTMTDGRRIAAESSIS